MAYQVAVCGPADCTDGEWTDAYHVGQLLAERGAVVICGGGGGVMAAVAAGARSRGGTVVGVRPDESAALGDPPRSADLTGTPVGVRADGAAVPDDRPRSADLSAVVYTGMGEARSAILVASADAVIVIGGSWGTLSEVALAVRRGDIPVVSLNGWQVLDAAGRPVPAGTRARDTVDAVNLAMPTSG